MAMSTPSSISRSPNAPPPPPPPLPSPPSVWGKIPLGKRAAVSNGISKPEKVRLVDLSKAVYCEMILEDIRIPLPDVADAILTLNSRALSYEQVCGLLEICPTEEEMETLKNYNGDKEQLGKCEQLFLELTKVPRVKSKLQVLAFTIAMSSRVETLRYALIALNQAAIQLKKSAKSRQIMEIMLTSGIILNASGGSTHKLNPSSLLHLLHSCAINHQVILMPSLCKLLEEKKPELLDFAKDLPHLDKACEIKLDLVVKGMQAVSNDLKKVERELTASQNESTFWKALNSFYRFSKEDFLKLVILKDELETNTDLLSKCYDYPSHVPLQHVARVLVNLRNVINKTRYEKACLAEEAERMEGHALKEHAANSLAKKIKSNGQN